ncbi:hypothetical protein GCM10011412_33650 [Maribacter cobaltidurans]|nr:hypothetical protein GCM10011412_33650 [Maribacter cobaltidurans]
MDQYTLETQKMRNQTLKELNDTKSRFYENITHEFRTPLTLILSPIEKKLSQAKTSLKEKEELSLMQRHAKQLLSLVNQMLDLAKLEENNVKLSVKPSNLQMFLNPLINIYQKKAQEKKILFSADMQHINNAWFDPDVIKKVATNLLSNAVNHSPQNGNIKVRSHVKNGYWIFNVTNTTETKNPIDISKLFTRYYRAGENSNGAGVGLNITKELVELSHGNIIANTLRDNELQFTVSLPIEESFFTENNENQEDQFKTKCLSDDDIEAAIITTPVRVPVPLDIPTSHGHPKLLIVEDNADMRSFIKSNFTKGYQILEAENGSMGMEQAIKHLPDIIISDVMMPERNGFEFCDAVKQNTFTSHIPVILLTAKVGEESEIKGFKTGADAYITKPFSVEKLKVRTKQLLQSQKRLSEHYRNTFSINPELAITNIEADFLKLLKKVLDEHITDSEFNTETFSSLMGMSRRQLYRKLKAIIHMTPNEFVRNERLKLAADLLSKSDATVTEIAYQVGFNSPSYFIKSFKEVYHITPNEFSAKK